MSSAPFDSELTGRSLPLGPLEGRRAPCPGGGAPGRTGAPGPRTKATYGTLGLLVGLFAPPGQPSGVAVREDCLVEVSEIMSKELVTVGPQYNVADVASLMHSRRIGSVLVLEDDRVLGILTERDILEVVGSGEDPNYLVDHAAPT